MARKERLAWYDKVIRIAFAKGPDHYVELQRQLCRTDLFYLLVFLLKRRDLNKDWLFDRCNEIQREPNERLDLWAREHGKALDCDTPVLTANRGWIRHGDLVPFDRVFSPSGKQVRVLANTGEQLGTECFTVRTCDGAEIVASKQHLWTVLEKHKLRVSGSDERFVSYTSHVVSTDQIGNKRQILPACAPLEMPPAALVVDPYVLGAWLGDGSKGGPCITAGIADAEEMTALLKATGIEVHQRRHSNAVTIVLGNGVRGKRGSNHFVNSLRGLGILKQKHIPAQYLTASVEQRRALLQGLMDTDGHCNTRGTAYFANTNRDLAEGVVSLVRSLGGRARLAERRIVKIDYPYFQVTFQTAGLSAFRFQRKKDRANRDTFSVMRRIASVSPTSSRPVNCIQVVGGNYLAGKDLVPTHNSSLITFGKTIQDILIDPEITVGIFSHTRPIAKAFLRTIKNEFQNNEELKQLFPEILWKDPEGQAPNWSEDTGLVVKRKGNPKESTVEAWGLTEGMPTSKHFALMVYDDLIDKGSVTNPDMVRKVTEAWEISLNLGKVGGRTRYIGTRYHFADPYREMINRGIKPRIYPCTVEGTWPGTPVLMPYEVLADKRRKMGVHTFSSQMLQDPAADKQQGFKRDWLRYYQDKLSGDGMTKYLLCDPANAKKRESDYTTMGVIGLGSDDNYYLLDGIRDRLNLTERGQALFELHRRWKPKGVGYEQYGMQSDIQYFETQMAEQEYRFEITPLGGKLAKVDRIRKLVPIFEAGRFFLPEQLLKTDYEGRVIDIIQAFVEEEYVAFPVGLHEDFFDMLARIGDEDLGVVWPKPTIKEDRYAAPKSRKNRARSAWAA